MNRQSVLEHVSGLGATNCQLSVREFLFHKKESATTAVKISVAGIIGI